MSGSKEEIGVTLDRGSENIGYCLGRLFAILEKVQEEAFPNTKSNIKERYYATASTTPAAVFPNLFKLKNSFIQKIQNKTSRLKMEREIALIFGMIEEIPKNLHLPDQGRFVVGYYHQRQEFFAVHGEE